MRNRNLLNRKLDNLESTLTNLLRIVNTQEPIETYKNNIGRALSFVEDIKSMVEMEPMDHNGN
jgi:hypothetical protein